VVLEDQMSEAPLPGGQPAGPRRRDGRRNGLIAAAIAIPLTVLLAFALAPKHHHTAASDGGVLPAINVNAPAPDDQTLGSCAQVMSALPVQLAGATATLAPRVVHPNPPTAQVAAWGDPAVVLVCGVARPASLVPNSSDPLTEVDGVQWLQTHDKSADVFVAIDRAVYVQVTVPSSSKLMPLSLLADSVAKALPSICKVPQQGQPAPATDELCTHRK
jgi:hypothetical protein